MDDNNLDFIGEVPINPYQQTYADTCAIKSQQLIMNDFGIQVTEDQCVQYSVDHGWYNGNGTAFEDIGKLLVDAGIPCTQSVDANIFDLIYELGQGHKVIVGVDSGELWSENSIWESIKEWFEDLFGNEIPDHALIVSAIDMTDPDNPMVILTDPGSGEACKPYPLDEFMDAWSDSQHFMVSTNIPTPAAATEFANLGINDYHLPMVAGVEFDIFQDFTNYSHQLDFGSDFMNLYHQFNLYPTMDMWTSFDDMLSYNADLFTTPYIAPLYDPIQFIDYSDLYTNLAIGLPDPTYTSFDGPSTVDEQRLHKLQDLLDDANRQYQNCLEHDMHVNATIWANQITDLQNEINQLTMGF